MRTEKEVFDYVNAVAEEIGPGYSEIYLEKIYPEDTGKRSLKPKRHFGRSIDLYWGVTKKQKFVGHTTIMCRGKKLPRRPRAIQIHLCELFFDAKRNTTWTIQCGFDTKPEAGTGTPMFDELAGFERYWLLTEAYIEAHRRGWRQVVVFLDLDPVNRDRSNVFVSNMANHVVYIGKLLTESPPIDTRSLMFLKDFLTAKGSESVGTFLFDNKLMSNTDSVKYINNVLNSKAVNTEEIYPLMLEKEILVGEDRKKKRTEDFKTQAVLGRYE